MLRSHGDPLVSPDPDRAHLRGCRFKTPPWAGPRRGHSGVDTVSKPKRSPDQAAIDMMTVGAFLLTTCTAYRASKIIRSMMDKVEDALDKVGDSAEDVSQLITDARSLKDDLQDMSGKYGPLGPVILGRTDKDEKQKVVNIWKKTGGKIF